MIFRRVQCLKKSFHHKSYMTKSASEVPNDYNCVANLLPNSVILQSVIRMALAKVHRLWGGLDRKGISLTQY